MLTWFASASLIALAGAALYSAGGAVRTLRARRVEADLAALAEATADSMVVVEGERVLAINAALRALAGLEAEAVELADLFPSPEARALIRDATIGAIETELRLADGREAPVEICVRPLTHGRLTCAAVTVTDLSERKAFTRKIAYLVRHDSLTGFLNRTAFEEELAARAADCERRGGGLTLLRFDLGRLGAVNEALGAACGDAALSEVAQRIVDIVDPDFIFGRVGGAQFAVLSGRRLERRALERLCLAIVGSARPAVLLAADCAATLSAHVGAAVCPYDGVSGDRLMANAEAALAEAAKAGDSGYRLFDTDLAERIKDRAELADEFSEALVAGQFGLVYQPQTSIRDGRVRGFEALARWRHPRRGLVGPDVFIPLAEETGQILALGAEILRQACEAASGWADHLTVSVNLSAVQLLTPGLTDHVADALEASGLAAERLELEVTEAALTRDPTRALAVLEDLKTLGVRIAMDDFGAGLSSLGNLRLFPVDRLKIDPTFVRDICHDAKSAAVIRSLMALGHGLGLEVIAEGVEEPEQLEALRRVACDSAQGYLLGRPGDVDPCYRPGENTIRFPLERRFAGGR